MQLQPRIATWRAVSSEEQADPEKDSLDYQSRLNSEHVGRIKGLVIANLEVKESRHYILWEEVCQKIPAYAQLNDLITRKAFDILMCLDATRLGRTASLVSTLVALCERAGIRIYETSSPPASISGPIGTSDARLLMLFKGYQSEQEIRKFHERSMFGRQARVKKGKHAGLPPYGYTRAFDEHGVSYFAVNEEQAAIVRAFYDLFLVHGRSFKAICEEFNARGLTSPRSGRPWIPGTIRQFVRNCWTYAGYASWGSIQAKNIPLQDQFRAKAEWQPLISEEMARQAVELLKQRTKAPRAVSSPHRLSMVAKCGYCGSTVTIRGLAGKWGNTTNRYECVRRCRGSRIGEPAMLAEIHAFIVAIQDHVNLEALIEDTPDHYMAMQDAKAEATKAMLAVREQRKRLTLAFTREAISFDEYESIMAELQTRHDDHAHTVAELEDVLAATPTAELRRARLLEVRNLGLAMLHHSDQRTANRWLREHVELIVADGKVDRLRII